MLLFAAGGHRRKGDIRMPDSIRGGPVGRESRDSVFLHVTLTSEDGARAGLFRVRNISSKGLMAVGSTSFAADEKIDVDLRNIGKIHARIAWCRDGCCGVRFDHPINPKLARRFIGRKDR